MWIHKTVHILVCVMTIVCVIINQHFTVIIIIVQIWGRPDITTLSAHLWPPGDVPISSMTWGMSTNTCCAVIIVPIAMCRTMSITLCWFRSGPTIRLVRLIMITVIKRPLRWISIAYVITRVSCFLPYTAVIAQIGTLVISFSTMSMFASMTCSVWDLDAFIIKTCWYYGMCRMYRLLSITARLSRRHHISYITTPGRLIPGRVGVQ